MTESFVGVGAILGGRLRIEREIGSGAMGVVYEATDEVLGRRVAVKVMARDLASNTEHVMRFDREARAVAKLTSDHVVRVLEVGKTDEGTPYIVMEHLEGRTLDAVLAGGPLPPSTAVQYVREALEGMREAHAAGLVHRDFKPGNLFLVERRPGGRPDAIKVLDFGVVKETAAGSVPLTRTGDTMGTPAYMAPEQIRMGEPVDARTDVWAIGVTLYELLTTELPFPGTSVPALLTSILELPPTSRREVPPPLEAIIFRCLAKKKENRYADAGEVADALAKLEASTPLPAETLELEPAPRTVPLPRVASAPRVAEEAHRVRAAQPQPVREPVRASGPGNLLLFGLAFALVLSLGALAFVIFLNRRAPRHVVSSPPEPSTIPQATASAPPPEPVPVTAEDVEAGAPDASAATSAPKPAPKPRVWSVLMTVQGGHPEAANNWLERRRPAFTACAQKHGTCELQSIVVRFGEGPMTANKRVVGEANRSGVTSWCVASDALLACVENESRNHELLLDRRVNPYRLQLDFVQVKSP